VLDNDVKNGKDDRIKEIISDISKDNPWGCSHKEYTYIVNQLKKVPNAKFLVFGLGNDTKLWVLANSLGKTIFIENEGSWIENTMKQLNADIREVKYSTRRGDWERLLENERELYLSLDKDILDTEWDFIFIDSPMGGSDDLPGRMQSIFMSSQLKCNNFFLHDVDRPVERVYGDKYLGSRYRSFDRMTHYKKIEDSGPKGIKITKSEISIMSEGGKPAVPTDRTLFKGITQYNFPGYTLVDLATEVLIYNFFVQKRNFQTYLDSIIDSTKDTCIFLCQHINAPYIKWRDSVVFTPHLWKGHEDTQCGSAHFNLLSKNIRGIDIEKDNLFSFFGAAHTHKLRRDLIPMYKTCTDSGGWLNQAKKEEYLNSIENSKFILCPRGTGSSSIRLFETLSMGRIPVTISDENETPLAWLLDWSEFSVDIKEKDIDKIPDILSVFSDREILDMAARGKKIWSTYFSPENMHRIYLIEMTRITRGLSEARNLGLSFLKEGR